MKNIWIALVLLCATPALAQTKQPALKLIPTPQQIEMLPGRCTSPGNVHIAHVEEPISKINGPDSYQLILFPTYIEIRSSSDAGAFYAMQTLHQLQRSNTVKGSIPCCRITDWPALQYRVWQDDISRGPIPSMDFLKREIRTLSSFKYNAMTLYTEHIFKLNKHPDIAPPDGLTAEQVKELVEYARPYHIEIIGNFQSFGHMAHILSLPAYKDLGDNDWNISPAKEASYKFLGDCYSEVAPAYESKLFDINCDEVTLGKEGASKEMVEKLGLAQVYAMHINRVADLLRPYGKTAMMWGDIAIQNPDIVSKLPKDLIVLSWGYSPEDSFVKWIEPFAKIGLRYMVCPGVNNWNRIFPNYGAAVTNISNFVRDGVKAGATTQPATQPSTQLAMQSAIGMVNTSWDDDGETFFNNTWYPFIWGAEVSWHPVAATAGESVKDANAARQARRDQFDVAFAANFFDQPDDSTVKLLHQLDNLDQNPVVEGLMDSTFWRDPFTHGQFKSADAHKLMDDAAHIASELEAAKKNVKMNADTLDYAIFAARRIEFVGRETATFNAIEQAVRESHPAITSLDHQRMTELLEEQRGLRAQYIKLWNAENRPWWLDQILAKYDRQTRQLEAAKHRVLFAPTSQPFEKSIDVTLLPVTDGPVHYTLDGSEPTANSPTYSSPIHLEKTVQVKARSFGPAGEAAAEADNVTYRTYVLPAKIQTTLKAYQDHDVVAAFDGWSESYFWGNHPDTGMVAGDLFTVILDNPGEFQSIRAITGQRDHKDDFLHAGVLEISSDGTTWEQAAEFKKGNASVEWKTKKTIKAVRLRATADQQAWLTIREIEVK